MLWYKRPIWNCGNVVIMDSGFCVTKGLAELRKKGLFGAALIRKRRYWPENIKGDAIDAHFALKEVGNDDAVKKVEDRLDYHVFCMKETDYVMKLMTKYGLFDPTDTKAQSKFKRSGVMETTDFIYTEVVANIFLYRHQVEDNNKRRHVTISIDRTWATKYWLDSCFDWYLAVSEVNANHAQSYFKDISYPPPPPELRIILEKEHLENTIGRYRNGGGG